MNRKLHVSEDLLLPSDTVTSTLVVYGGKGMGKTNFGAVLAEELAAAGHRFAFLDPVGVSWGLQYGATQSQRGLEVLILGGLHGDIPIQPTAGAVVADLVADEGVNVVIDISRHASGRMWNKAEKIRFVADYCSRLYERQGEARVPLMQIIDEAGRFCPQQIPHGAPDLARCVGAIEELVELGRNVGVGVTLITQRSARMNKSVSELAECMLAFRTVGPNSVGAVVDWLGEHVEKASTNKIVEQLRTLPRGTAVVVSPGWLQYEGVIAVRARKTYDSSSTPEAGARNQAHGKAAKPDLKKYRARMAATIEQAEANDPRALKTKIMVLEKKLLEECAPSRHLPKASQVHTVYEPVLKDRQLQRAETLLKRLDATMSKANGLRDLLNEALRNVIAGIGKVSMAAPSSAKHTPAVAPVKPKYVNFPTDVGLGQEGVTKNNSLPPSKQRILDALAWLEGVGLPQADKVQLAFLADASPRSGGYLNNLGNLRSAGQISYPTPGSVALTELGRELAKPGSVPQTSQQLHQAVLAKLPPSRKRILSALLHEYPQALPKGDLAAAALQSANSGGYLNSLGAMRSLGVLEYPAPGMVRAADIMFLKS